MYWFSHINQFTWPTVIEGFLAAVDWFSGLEPRIWQALITGSFLAAGWVYNGWRDRRVDQLRREERRRDIHQAIGAEISAYRENMEEEHPLGRDNGLEERIDEIAGKMEADCHTLVPRERTGRLFEALAGEIHILPGDTIKPVTRYYTLLGAIEMLADDLRGEWFRKSPKKRRVEAYKDYLLLKVQAYHEGANALRKIKALLDGRE